MRKVVQTYKRLGETPLQAINRLRWESLEFVNEKMTYLGRLDPMAEGLLLVLVGDTSNKEEYLSLDKEYEFEVLWGFESDTYDVLGIVKARRDSEFSSVSEPACGLSGENSESLLVQIQNIKKQTYPPYSSKKVQGKQLFEWARAGEEVERPERNIKIYSIEHLGNEEKTGIELLSEIMERIDLVKGDFRQEEIIEGWKKTLSPISNSKFLISKFRAHVSSGTYIRGLVQEMGEILGCGALTYSIKRTRVGEYSI